MDDAERRRLVAELAADLPALAATVRAERDRRAAAGLDTAWLDRVLGELRQIAAQAVDVNALEALRTVVERHGGGPWPVDDLAAIAGVDVADARRLLASLVAEGLAKPAGPDDD